MNAEESHTKKNILIQSSVIAWLLITGLFIYWLFSPGIFLFRVFGITNHDYIRAAGHPFYSFIRNYVPDFLWAIAVFRTGTLLGKIGVSAIYIRILFAIPFLSELLQGLAVIPGTFDVFDLLIYLAVFIYYFIFKITTVMKKRMKALLGPLAILLFIAAVFACITPTHTTRTAPAKPGFYGVTSRWNGGADDINGEVGHRLNVSGPRARCITCTNCQPGSWNSSYYITSGSLPPGLSIGSGYDISGIPSERGHWIVKIKLYDIMCNGSNYDKCCSFEQELRFHITGSGRVNN